MAEVWAAYVAKYGKDPDNHTQLMNFSKKDDSIPTLSFKEAKAAFASGGAGASAPTASAQEPSESKEEAAGGTASLFAELSQGLSVTSGLKKVTRDMKTKHRSDRTGKVAAAPKKKAPATAKKTVAKKKKPPSLAKRGLRWVAEYFTEEVHTLETTEASSKEDVFITQCSNCGFLVNNKVKAVTIEGCQNVQVQLSDVISTVEVINCKKVKLFLMGKAPSLIIDKCQDPKVYLSLTCFRAEPKLVTSMVSDMMVEIEGETPEDDTTEMPIPYQFETLFDTTTRAATTTAVLHG